jgi:hypothetical protein
VQGGGNLIGLKAEARRFLVQLVLWFLFSLVLSIALGDVSCWAEKHDGWQAGIVSFVFGLLAAVPLFGIIFFGIALWSWPEAYHSSSKGAASD